MHQSIGVMAQSNSGTLLRIVSLVSRKGYNVVSISSGRSHVEGVSRFTLVLDEDNKSCDILMRQLERLVDVVKVARMEENCRLERQLMLVRINCSEEERNRLLHVTGVFRGRIVDMGRDALVVEITGEPDKLDAFLENVRPFGILDVSCGGSVAMRRSGFSDLELELNREKRSA